MEAVLACWAFLGMEDLVGDFGGRGAEGSRIGAEEAVKALSDMVNDLASEEGSWRKTNISCQD